MPKLINSSTVFRRVGGWQSLVGKAYKMYDMPPGSSITITNEEAELRQVQRIVDEFGFSISGTEIPGLVIPEPEEFDPGEVGVVRVATQEEFEDAVANPEIYRIIITASWTQSGQTTISTSKQITIGSYVLITLSTGGTDRWSITAPCVFEGVEQQNSTFYWVGGGQGLVLGSGGSLTVRNMRWLPTTSNDLGGQVFMNHTSGQRLVMDNVFIAPAVNGRWVNSTSSGGHYFRNCRIHYYSGARTWPITSVYAFEFQNIEITGNIDGGVELFKGMEDYSGDTIIQDITIRANGDADTSGTKTKIVKGTGLMENLRILSDTSDFELEIHSINNETLTVKDWDAPGLDVIFEASTGGQLYLKDCALGDIDTTASNAALNIDIQNCSLENGTFVRTTGTRTFRMSNTFFSGNVSFDWRGTGSNRITDVVVDGTMTIESGDINLYKNSGSVGTFTNNSGSAILINTAQLVAGAVAGTVAVRDAANGVSGDVDELVFPTGSLVIDSTTGTIRSLPNNGANYDSPSLASTVLTMALTMNSLSSPVMDIALDGYLTATAGTPAYGQTGHFAGGTAITLGRANGLLTRTSNPFLAPTSATFGAHTISFWAKPLGNSASEVGYFFSFYNGTNDRYYLFSDTTSIRLVDINSSTLTANVTYATLAGLGTPIDIYDGAFHHFACTRSYQSGRYLEFYIDGQLVAQNNDAAQLEIYGVNTSIFNIGGQNNSITDSAHVTYDEFVMSNDQWSGTQVLEAYNGGTGTSFATVVDTPYGFEEAIISDYNSKISHVWLMNEAAGNVAQDHAGIAAITGEGAGITRYVTGRWPGTYATRISRVSNTRFARRNSFDGPDADTPWAISMDVKINSAHSGSGASYIFEMGPEGVTGTTTRVSLGYGSTNVLGVSLNGVGPSITITSIIADGNFHTITFGCRENASIKETFLAVDGAISVTTPATWRDFTDEAIDITVGETLVFNATSANVPADMDIQNIVFWNNANFTDSHITALNGAQLVVT